MAKLAKQSAVSDQTLALSQAIEEARLDAGSYDTFTMGVDQPLAYRIELEAKSRKWLADLHLQESWRQIRTERKWAQTIEEIVEERERAANFETQLSDANIIATEQKETLQGDGPYADPARVYESAAISLLKELAPSTVVGSSEVSLNYLVFEGFNFTTFETWVLSITISIACVFGAHLIGVWSRKRRGVADNWRQKALRFLLPAALASLLSLVQVMVAVLRGGFLNKPQTNDDGDQLPSLLAGMHIPLWLIIVGWWALQAALTMYIASHVEETHNPHVQAHRKALRQTELASQTLTRSRSRIASLEMTEITLSKDLERISLAFAEQRNAMDAFTDQLMAVYIRALSRTKLDPEFTAVAEQRLARDHRASSPPEVPTELHSVPPEYDEEKPA
ncbi:hypothetical protein [Jatrophihabitans sp.]|uniref:hypothetical protein n=1 Tax=Jatrophihabitans sp. TaxID=1932789 RepID=UPI0038CD8EB1